MHSFTRSRWLCGLTLVAATALAPPAAGQYPAYPSGPFRFAQRPETPQPPAEDTEAVARTEQQTAVLNLIASNRVGAQERKGLLEKEQADWETKLAKLATEGLTEPRPYSYLALDKARDTLDAEQQNAKSLSDAINTAKEAVTRATTGQTDKERELRRAKDELEHNKDPAAEARLTQAISDAEHELTVAQQMLTLRRDELANLQLDAAVQTLRLDYARKRHDFYKQDAVFTPAMRDSVFADIDQRAKAVADRSKKVSDDLNKFLQPQWYQARERLDAARAAPDQSTVPALAAEVQAKDLAQQLADFEIGVNVTKVDRYQDLRAAWQRRFEHANARVPMFDAALWIDESKAARERLRSDAATLQANSENVEKQLNTIEKKLQDADTADATLRAWLDKAQKSLEAERRFCERALAELEPAVHVYDKLIEDLTSGTISSAAMHWLADTQQAVAFTWDYEVANIQDRSITVGRIVKGLILFFLGLYLSRVLSRTLEHRLLNRWGVNASASAAFHSVAFYLLVLLFTLFALKIVEVPLTAFTVLGGAVALGVGFGSQNIVNNFISGLILLAERPVKVGDLIQVGDVYGNVEHIGARSTRVRTGDSLDIIVPNSSFLETNVVNWTCSDNNMRACIKFGVMYGSSTGKLTQLALKAAIDHDRVFDRPAPFVIFADFGENALLFELHFWVAVRTWMERRQIESDLRFALDNLFKDAGLVMAYPQRDVHLYTQEPLRVQMTPASPGEAA